MGLQEISSSSLPVPTTRQPTNDQDPRSDTLWNHWCWLCWAHKVSGDKEDARLTPEARPYRPRRDAAVAARLYCGCYFLLWFQVIKPSDIQRTLNCDSTWTLWTMESLNYVICSLRLFFVFKLFSVLSLKQFPLFTCTSLSKAHGGVCRKLDHSIGLLMFILSRTANLWRRLFLSEWQRSRYSTCYCEIEYVCYFSVSNIVLANQLMFIQGVP